MTSSGGVVALLFTDLVRSTELLARLGDDAADELRRRHFASLRQAVAASGGEEVKSLGDGLMVSFASPMAAVSCAEAMQRSVTDSGLELRVGIHAGEPIRDESDLFGGAVVVARRLCDRAEGGQILTSELVADLVGGRGSFRFRPVGPLALKGLPDPVRAVTVEWREIDPGGPASGPSPEQPSPARARRARGPRLIGRDRELKILEDELDAACAGEFRCVLLTAEAGIGKSRLAAELATRHASDVIALSARGHPMGETTAFAVWAEALDGYLRSLDSRDVTRLCGGLLDDLAGLLRSVAAARGSVPDRPAPRTSILEGLTVVVHNLARTRPVLVLLDDVHQADASSWETLDYLARGLEPAPVLVVMGARPAELSGQQVPTRILLGLDQDGFLRRLPLALLPPDDMAALAAEVLHAPPAPALVAWLTERSSGNPLFALGLLRALIDEGADLERPQLRRLPEDLAERVQDLLGTFEEPARHTIEVLSVLGRPATRDELAAFCDRTPAQLEEVVMELVRFRTVAEEEHTGEVRYGFIHPLVQETVYQTLGSGRRRALHRLIGQALRAAGRGGEAAPHFARSAAPGDDEAITTILEAVRAAEERSAFRESLTLLTALVDVLPSGHARWLEAADALTWQADWVMDRGRGDKLTIAAIRAMREIDRVLESSPDHRRRAAVKLRLASFLINAAGQVDEGVEAATAAEELYRAAGDATGAGLACVIRAGGHVIAGDLTAGEQELERLFATTDGDDGGLVAERARGILGLVWFFSGSFERDEANLVRMLAAARARRNEYLETLYLSGLGMSHAFQGRTNEARAAVERAKAASPSWRESPVLEYEVQSLWLEGDLATALERAEEIIEWNPEGVSRRRAVGLTFAGVAALEAGRLGDAQRYVGQALEAYEGRPFAACFHCSLHAEGLLVSRGGHPSAALEKLEYAGGWLAHRRWRPFAVFVLTDLAEIAATAGRAEDSARAATGAASSAAAIDGDSYDGVAMVAAAWAALAAGIEDEAADHARNGVKILSRTGWRLFQGRALHILGRTLAHSDPAGAREALDAAVAVFEACGAVWRRDRALEARP